jgi:glutamate-1-semialdehyde aminotransferase/spore coat polysaccharide biosynthesis protein SpsF (cytidylyltransferase family)
VSRPIAVIQARTGSSRLPGKVLADLGGAPLLARMIERLGRARTLAGIVVATTDRPADDAVAALAADLGVGCFRGSEQDVLARFAGAAVRFDADPVVRLTADCPLIDPALVDACVEAFLAEPGCDYASLGGEFPDGLDTEVVSAAVLRRAHAEARLPSEREHVTPFVWKRPETFRCRSVPFPGRLGGRRWTVDEPRDLDFVRAVWARLHRPGTHFGWQEVEALLAREPALAALNAGIERNAGYRRSLEAEAGRTHPASDALWARAERIIPCGTQTLSKKPSQFVRGVYPKYLVSGRGCRVTCADGHEYIDWPMALGAILLGHAYPAVAEAVAAQARAGSLFSLPHPLEVEVAERLVDLVPCAEMARFMKNGSDATTAAVRIARAYTGRARVAYCGYHGWQDWFAGTTPLPAGVPDVLAALARPFEWNRPETLAALLDADPGGYAAVIFEEPGEAPAPGFLAGVVELAHRHGAVVIWDEIVTGLRWAPGGAQARHGVTPDLACFGKALGNGLPIAALVGARPLMTELERVFVSMTFGGDALALAAARAVLDEVRTRPVVDHLWTLGGRWLDGARALCAAADTGIGVGGAAPRSHFTFTARDGFEPHEIRSLFLQECVKRGVLFGVPIFMSFSHREDDVAETLAAVEAALAVVADGLRRGDLRARLEGPPVEPVFRPAAPGAGRPAAPGRRPMAEARA